MPHPRIPNICLGHVAARVETVDLLHEVEHDAEHVEVVAPGDEAGVRNVVPASVRSAAISRSIVLSLVGRG